MPVDLALAIILMEFAERREQLPVDTLYHVGELPAATLPIMGSASMLEETKAPIPGDAKPSVSRTEMRELHRCKIFVHVLQLHANALERRWVSVRTREQ